MERDEATARLKELIGCDLVEVARKHQVVIERDGKINKGWKGHTLERHLGLPLNSCQAPNFGSWELKQISLKRLKNGLLAIKETMAVTMIDPQNVLITDFDDSHLLRKLSRGLLVAVIGDSTAEAGKLVHSVSPIDVPEGSEVYKIIRDDYELVRMQIRRSGFESLTGRMGTYIQPRTKGAGHGSTSRAFYARKEFLGRFVRLGDVEWR